LISNLENDQGFVVYVSPLGMKSGFKADPERENKGNDL
jgi:hypothetical protein